MKIIVTKDYDKMSEKAFEIMSGVVKSNPRAVLGLATGTTPLGLYKLMTADCKDNGTSYKKIRTVNLDEYAGLDITSPQSYVYFMRENLFKGSISRLKIRISRTARRRTRRLSARVTTRF